MRGNQGQIFGYAIMLSMVLLVLALALAPSVKKFADDAMNDTVGDRIGLDCNNESISNWDKGSCVLVDWSQAYFIVGILLIALAVLTARILF